MVGVEICQGTYRLAKKSLKRWVGAELPGTLQELQRVLGRLLWASPFVPNFKEKVRPIEVLLSPKSSGEWTEECTEALNDILRVVEKRLTLAVADPHSPMELYVSVGAATGLVVITQASQWGEVRVIALVGRGLTDYEAQRPPLEQKLHMAAWALHRCRRFTATAPKI